MATRVFIGDAQFPEGERSVTPVNSEVFWVDINWQSAPGDAFDATKINFSDARSEVTLSQLSETVFRARVNTMRAINTNAFTISIPADVFDDNPQAIKTLNIDSMTSRPIWRDMDWITYEIRERDIQIPTFWSAEVRGVEARDFQLKGIIDGRTYEGNDYIRQVNAGSVDETSIGDTPILVSIQLPPESFGIVALSVTANSVLNARGNRGPATDISSPKQLVFDTRGPQDIIDTTELKAEWRVLLLGADITEHVEQVQNVVHRLDLQNPTEFKISNATIMLINENGFFSPENPENFFVENGGVQNGYKAEVTIISGFVGGSNDNILMRGEIIEVQQQENVGRVTISVSEQSQALRNQQLNDFGITKYASVSEDGSQFHGRYPFLAPVTPVSDTSVTAESGSIQLREVQALKKEGITDTTRFTLRDSVIETEVPFGPGSTLTTEFKAPFRNKTIDYLIRQILEYHDINNYSIDIPGATGSPTFATRGRIGYDIESSRETDRNSAFGWRGYVTDYLFQQNSNDGFGLGSGIGGLTYHNGAFWGQSTSQNRLMKIDPVTGFGSWAGPAGYGIGVTAAGGNGAAGMTYWRGYFWAATRDGGSTVALFRVDTDTGIGVRMKDLDNPTQDWSQRVPGHPTGLTIVNDVMYQGARQGLSPLEFNADLTAVKLSTTEPYFPFTGRRTILPGVDLRGFESIAFHNNLIYCGTVSGSWLVTIDPITSEMAVIGSQSDITLSSMTEANGQLWGGNLSIYNVNPSTAELTPIASSTKFWFLYSSPDTATFPQILEYDTETDELRVAYQHGTHAEFWGIITRDYNNFFILATENATSNPIFAPEGTYDAGEPNSRVKILQWNRTSQERTTFIDPENVTLNPQLAQYYHFGYTGGDSRHGSRPDTRKRNLEFYTWRMLYIWANASSFGLANAEGTDNTSALISIPKDKRRNHMGFDWTIDGTTIYGAHTKQSTTDSHLFIYSTPAP